MTLTGTSNNNWKTWPRHNKIELARRLAELSELKLDFRPPQTDEELKQVVEQIAGITIPDQPVCDGHSSPFQAFADAYFARSSVAVWKASRGFGGKSVLLATLAYTEAICLKASVNLLGGSGEQAQRLHSYTRGDDTNLPDTFWESPGSPKQLLMTDPTQRETKLINGGRLKVLMASSKSVRGPHPQRLRIDECLSGDSLIMTPTGQIRMDALKVGLIVLGYTNIGEVTHDIITSFKNKDIRQTLIITLEDGNELTCTNNHKIRTDQGWRYASELREGDRVIQIDQELFELSKGTPKKDYGMESNWKKDGTVPSVLSREYQNRDAPLSDLWDIEKGTVSDASSMLQQTSRKSISSLPGLRDAVISQKDNPLSFLLANSSLISRNDSADGCGESDCFKKWKEIQGRDTMRGVIGFSPDRIFRASSDQALDRGFSLSRQFDHRSTWGVLARQTGEDNKRQQSKRGFRAGWIQSSVSKERQVTSLVAITGIRTGPKVPVYDIGTLRTNTFIANGIVVHNCDEVEREIYEAAMGQAMEARGIREQTVLSSTHQYADGTMTEILKQAGSRGFKVYEWCYKESMQPHGWLVPAQVERKRNDVPRAMWDVEYELQTPNPGARAITPEKVEAMFDRSLGDVPGELGVYYEFEKPIASATYAHGADWARKVDHTVIITFRTDVTPIRLVAFERKQKQPWPLMVSKLDERVNHYGGEAAHDGTGLGDVIDGYLQVDAEGFIFVGRQRSELLNNYITAVEGGEIVSPYIEYMVTEHLYASVDDVYGSGHLPDTMSSGALGYRASEKRIDWSQVDELGHVDDYEEESLWR